MTCELVEDLVVLSRRAGGFHRFRWQPNGPGVCVVPIDTH
jgi:signal transduction histidine kinase